MSGVVLDNKTPTLTTTTKTAIEGVAVKVIAARRQYILSLLSPWSSSPSYFFLYLVVDDDDDDNDDDVVVRIQTAALLVTL